MGNAQFFEDVEFAGGERPNDFVFEEKYVDIPQVAIDNDQDQASIPDIIQEATPDQDNINQFPVQVVLEEPTLQPQEPLPLRRSTREKKNAILDDYIVFLQEHDFDIGVMEDDPIKFYETIKSYNSQK